MGPGDGGVPGNQVLWDSSHVEALMDQEGEQGGRALMQRHRDQITWLDLPDASQQTDVDTPEAYASLISSRLRPAPAELLLALGII